MGKVISDAWLQLCNRNIPSVVQGQDGHYLLAIRANDNGVLLYDLAQSKTMIQSRELFLSNWSGTAITFNLELMDS